MLGDVVADPHERIGQNVRIDYIVREHRIGMNIHAVAALLDVDPPLFKRNIVDRSKLVAPDIVKVLTAPEFRFLRRKAVAVDWRSCSSATHPNET